MTTHDDELRADSALMVNDNALKSVSVVVGEYDVLMTEKKEIVERLKEIDEQLRMITTKTLPELLAAAGVSSFTHMETGRVVEIELQVFGELPKKDLDARAATLRYLETIGAGPLIKTKISVIMERGKIKESKALMKRLKEEGFEPTLTEDVHAGTLAAFGRELIRDGKDFEAKKAGLFIENVAVPREVKTPAPRKVRGRGKR